MSAFVEFRNVRKVYKTGEVEISALNDVNFEIEKGEKYILFLEYNEMFEHYYGSFQPWAIEIVNDKAVLKGNLPELHKDFHDEITGLKHVDLVKKLK